jgi:phosphoribosyl 1,2-cyclic phosphate phosphodiesterase
MFPIELTFLGSGTSAGVPMIGCHCPVCRSTDPHDKRTRPSAIIRYQDLSVLVDATPELRVQCLANAIDRIDAIVVTHAHADHIMGLDDVRRFNAMSGQPLDVWADKATHSALQRCFGYAFSGPDPQDPVFKPQLVAREIVGPFAIGAATWVPVPLIHGRHRVLGFRIGPLAYCTDVSAISEESFRLLDGVELLVLGALQRAGGDRGGAARRSEANVFHAHHAQHVSCRNECPIAGGCAAGARWVESGRRRMMGWSILFFGCAGYQQRREH